MDSSDARTAEPAASGDRSSAKSARWRWLAAWPGKLAALIRRHPVFSAAFGLAIVLRAIVMIAFQPIMWFTDSSSYLGTALNHQLATGRPGGYPILLVLLDPLHSFEVVALVQHLLGLGTGLAIYAVLRRRGLPGWGATLAAAPVLFDAYQLQLEHLLMSDALFIALVVWVIVLLLWNDKLRVRIAVVAGLLLGYASVVRAVGVPLLAVVLVCLALRKVGWRPIVALVVMCVLPVAAYMVKFDEQHRTFGITDSTGIFLYDRVMEFANCAEMKPTRAESVLCDPRPQSQRRQPPLEYIWDYADPIYRLTVTPAAQFRSLFIRPGRDQLGAVLPQLVSTNIFTPQIDGLAQKFAERAILAQPLDYVKAVAADTIRSFYWGSPIPYDSSNVQYLFTDHVVFARSWLSQMRAYQRHLRKPHIVRPLANFLIAYQRWIYVRGTMAGLILLMGFAGLVRLRRRWGGLILLPWTVSVLLIILPPMTIGFNSRYVLAAVPCACLAAGLAAVRRPSLAVAGESETLPRLVGAAAEGD